MYFWVETCPCVAVFCIVNFIMTNIFTCLFFNLFNIGNIRWDEWLYHGIAPLTVLGNDSERINVRLTNSMVIWGIVIWLQSFLMVNVTVSAEYANMLKEISLLSWLYRAKWQNEVTPFQAVYRLQCFMQVCLITTACRLLCFLRQIYIKLQQRLGFPSFPREPELTRILWLFPTSFPLMNTYRACGNSHSCPLSHYIGYTLSMSLTLVLFFPFYETD